MTFIVHGAEYAIGAVIGLALLFCAVLWLTFLGYIIWEVITLPAKKKEQRKDELAKIERLAELEQERKDYEERVANLKDSPLYIQPKGY